MNDLVREFVDDFKQRGWKSPVYPRFFSLVDRHRELLPELVRATMDELPQGGNFQGDAVSYLSENELPALIERALELLGQAGENKAAHQFLEHAAMQCPWRFHYLVGEPFDWSVSRNQPAACHDAGELYVVALIALAQANNDFIARSARRCLLETRAPAAPHWIAAHPARSGVESETLEVGWEKRDDKWRQLYSDSHWHLNFPAEYWPAENEPEHRSHGRHPTWTAPGAGAPMRFGGAGAGKCAGCQGQLHHLITLAPVPPELKISLDKLQLEVCLSCLGWETERLFYVHDETGAPRPIGDETPRTPQFPVGNLDETRVQLANTGRRWQWQNWGLANGRENLHRVGGHPTWIQSADYPHCPQCDETMRFLMQLDSELPIDYGDGRKAEWLWGSGGIGYVFWCDACRVSGYECQWT